MFNPRNEGDGGVFSPRGEGSDGVLSHRSKGDELCSAPSREGVVHNVQPLKWRGGVCSTLETRGEVVCLAQEVRREMMCSDI